MTELRKAQNRMAFGKEEKEVGYGTGEGTKGLGMVGMGNDGRIRATQIDQRTKAKLSKNNKGWGTGTPAGGAGGLGTASSFRGFGQGGSASSFGLRSSGVGGGEGGSGTASSIAFTPVQGLELVDPKVRSELKRKREEEQDRWFKGGTFTQVGGGGGGGGGGAGGGGGSGSGGGKVDSGGFKVPALPPGRKSDTGPPAKK